MPTGNDEVVALDGEMKAMLADIRSEIAAIRSGHDGTTNRGNERFREEARAELVMESYKQLILVNGGAAAGLITFLQSVRNEQVANAMANAAVVFAIGVVVALLSGIARFRHSVEADALDKRNAPGLQGPWWFRRRLHLWVQVLSALCFLVGSGYLSWSYRPESNHRDQPIVVRLDNPTTTAASTSDDDGQVVVLRCMEPWRNGGGGNTAPDGQPGAGGLAEDARRPSSVRPPTPR